MLAIVNKMQLPIFSLFNVFLSAIGGPLFFFLFCAILVPVVLLIIIDSTFIKFFAVVQSLRHVKLFETLWTEAHHTSLSLILTQSLLKHVSIESVMPSSHLTLLMLMV